jgi:hypothetical protein
MMNTISFNQIFISFLSVRFLTVLGIFCAFASVFQNLLIQFFQEYKLAFISKDNANIYHQSNQYH